MNSLQKAPALVVLLLAMVGSGFPGSVFAEETRATTEEQAQDELFRQIQQLRERIAELEKKQDPQGEEPADDDLADLLAEAAELTKDEVEREQEIETERKSAKGGGQRSLQAMNPEISFLGDIAYEYTSGDMKDGFRLLGAELGLQAALDPYTRFKAFLGAHQEPFELELGHDPDAPAEDDHAHSEAIGLHVGEMFMEWVALPGRLNLTVGKFRQQYGTLNRWHIHALPTVEIPFALRNTFGHMGLVGLGVDLYWQLPSFWSSSNALTLQITNADNPVAFAGSAWRDPAFLLRYTAFFDLGPDAYFDFGLNAVQGANDESGDNKTLVAGVDINYLWEPVQRARYRNIELRGEWIYTRAQQPAADAVTANSFYFYLTFKVSRQWSIGFRFDDAELPFDRFHLFDPDTLQEMDFREGLREVALTPYLTFWQSEFVRLRLQYQHVERDFATSWGGDSDNKVWVQATFAVGPHKHDQY